jgi:hypothetical protein
MPNSCAVRRDHRGNSLGGLPLLVRFPPDHRLTILTPPLTSALLAGHGHRTRTATAAQTAFAENRT